MPGDRRTLLDKLLRRNAAVFRARAVAARELATLRLSVKYFGYELARSLAASLPPICDTLPTYVGLASKPATQADMSADWMRHWCGQLAVPVYFHRKLWEFGYILQALHEHGLLEAGTKGLGFGCGLEPLPSYFAKRGMDVTMTDLAPEAVAAADWIETNQHAGSIDRSFYGHLVDRELFDRHVRLRYMDMNAIDPALVDYDFCWSSCALEHLGSIEQGLNFIVNAMATVKPGGLAVHTTEFNFADEGLTVESGSTVLFQRRHLKAVSERLTALGHTVAPLSFDIGDLPLDKFIDVPPFPRDQDGLSQVREAWGDYAPALKLTVSGFPCTSFGIVIVKSGSPT